MDTDSNDVGKSPSNIRRFGSFRGRLRVLHEDENMNIELSRSNTLRSSTTRRNSLHRQLSLRLNRNRISGMWKTEKRDDIPDDFGSGRTIPTKQGYLYKRSHNSLKEWKKKYVTICDNGTLVYYPNMKEYIEETNAKSINLAHTTVKVPGKRPPKLAASGNQKNAVSDVSSSDAQKKQQSKRNSMHKDYDAVIISNSLAASPSQTQDNEPSLDGALVKASQGIISTGIHGTPKNGASPTKKKNRRHGGRHAKSCEIDYGQICSDIENNPQGTPLSARRRGLHKRNKSGASKELQFDKGTDTEDGAVDDMVFTIISLDGKSWDFESTTPDERDIWVSTIEQQILKAFQTGIGNRKQERITSSSSTCSTTSLKSSLRTIAGNDRCADCGSQDPEWASINLGILVCIECSGVHRNLGTHLSRVRSVDLDDWPPESVAIMKLIGNEYANNLWESVLLGKRKLSPNSTREEREDYIHRKYRKKEFLKTFDTTHKTLGQQIIEAVKADEKKSCYSLLVYSSVNDVNIRTNDSRRLTPLHISCKLGSPIITQLLLWYFVDPRALDADGLTAMSYARDADSKECLELLAQFGCPEDTPC
eukprot:gene3383-3873_t